MARNRSKPWDSAQGDVRKVVSLRFPLRTLAQLAFIAEREDRTQQKIMDRIVLPALERQAEDLWKRSHL